MPAGADLVDSVAVAVREVAAEALRLDRSRYQPTQTVSGLLIAADDRSWAAARSIVD